MIRGVSSTEYHPLNIVGSPFIRALYSHLLQPRHKLLHLPPLITMTFGNAIRTAAAFGSHLDMKRTACTSSLPNSAIDSNNPMTSNRREQPDDIDTHNECGFRKESLGLSHGGARHRDALRTLLVKTVTRLSDGELCRERTFCQENLAERILSREFCRENFVEPLHCRVYKWNQRARVISTSFN